MTELESHKNSGLIFGQSFKRTASQLLDGSATYIGDGLLTPAYDTVALNLGGNELYIRREDEGFIVKLNDEILNGQDPLRMNRSAIQLLVGFAMRVQPANLEAYVGEHPEHWVYECKQLVSKRRIPILLGASVQVSASDKIQVPTEESLPLFSTTAQPIVKIEDVFGPIYSFDVRNLTTHLDKGAARYYTAKLIGHDVGTINTPLRWI